MEDFKTRLHWDIANAGNGIYDVAVVCVATDTICSMKFTGMLFQIGTNRFIDLLPVKAGVNSLSGLFLVLLKRVTDQLATPVTFGMF